MGLLSIFGKISLDSSQFDAALNHVAKGGESLGKKLKSSIGAAVLGAFSIHTITNFARGIGELASEVKDLQDRLGVSAKDAQDFGLAAKLGGQSAETFAKALEKIRLASAKGDNPLSIFGVTADQMRAGVPALRQLAEGMKGFTGTPEQTKALADVFGTRGLGQVVNMVSELENVKGALTFTDKEVSNIDKALDVWKTAMQSMKVAAVRLIGLHPSMLLTRTLGGSAKAPVPTAETMEETEAQGELRRKAHMATQDRILDIDKEAARVAEETRVAQLTKEERLNELIQERERLFSTVAKTEEERARKALNLVKNESAIAALSTLDKPEAVKEKGLSPLSDSLRSVGRFGGEGGQNPTINKLSNIERELREIRRNTARQMEGTSFPL